MKRKLSIILVVIFISINLASCYDKREIDDMAYVIAMGLEKGKTNTLRMTLQFAVPGKSAGGEGGGNGGGGSGSTDLTVIETPTIYAGLNMINTYISKEVNFFHAQLVVFSEELAREGVSKYIHAMERGREFRGDMHIAVAKDCTAEDYLRNVKPTLELNPAKYYEMNLDSYKYTGFVGDSRMINFYLFEECTCRQAFATLVGVNRYQKTEEFTNDLSTYKEKNRELPLEGDFYAGSIPKVYDIKSEIMGIAVFDGDRMVGTLDGSETTCQQMLYGDFGSSYMSIPDPNSEGDYILLNVKQSRKPTHKVTLENGVPKIKAKVKLEADILSIQSGENYESTDNTAFLESSAAGFIKKEMLGMLNKTIMFNSDVCGFGRDLKKQYLLWDDWSAVNWLKIYEKSTFDIDVELKIRRPGLMIRTAPAKGSMGEVK
jgi:spore germination protein KC